MIGRVDKEFRVEGIQFFNFSIEKLVLLGTIYIKQLMKLIFVTASGEITKLEQPEFKLCLYWPKHRFQILTFGSIFQNFKMRCTFSCKS